MLLLMVVAVFAGCTHAKMDATAPSERKVEGKARAFELTTAIRGSEASYCLSVILNEKYSQGGSSGEDRLVFPDVCIPKGDVMEHVMSLWSRDSAPVGERLPFREVRLPEGENGQEVRFKVSTNSEGAAVANYTITYRNGNARRDHVWTGSDAFPPSK